MFYYYLRSICLISCQLNLIHSCVIISRSIQKIPRCRLPSLSFLLPAKAKGPSLSGYSTHARREKKWINNFPNGICVLGNATNSTVIRTRSSDFESISITPQRIFFNWKLFALNSMRKGLGILNKSLSRNSKKKKKKITISHYLFVVWLQGNPYKFHWRFHTKQIAGCIMKCIMNFLVR